MGDFKKDFYTVPQAAELLQVHPKTIYNLAHQRKFEYYKVGAQIRIAAAELERRKVKTEKVERSYTMTKKEKLNLIDDAIFYTKQARSQIIPLSYDDPKMSDAQAALLEAAQGLEYWMDILNDPDKRAKGTEKRYIMTRLRRAEKYLDERREGNEGGNPAIDKASDDLDTALKKLNWSCN